MADLDPAAIAHLTTHAPPDWRWTKLPKPLREAAGSEAGWLSTVKAFMLAYQHPWNAHAGVDEPAYLELVLKHSREHGQLYPYHLAAALHESLRSPMSPFEYYVEVLYERMSTERSYDTIPNFAAADCMRLLKVGRNEFIHALNACRAKGWMWKRRKAVIVKQLPARPTDDLPLHHWWVVHLTEAAVALLERGGRERAGSAWASASSAASLVRRATLGTPPPRASTSGTPPPADDDDDDDAPRVASPIVDPGGLAPAELEALQTLHAAGGSLQAGRLARAVVPSLYAAGLVRYDVPVGDGDRISVPPLSGFVMNRVGNDYLEKLLYEVFVTNDESLTVAQLAALLGQPPPLVTAAVSVACRLGFAQLKTAPPLPTADATADAATTDSVPPWHPSWGTSELRRARVAAAKGAAAAAADEEDEAAAGAAASAGVGRLALLVDSKIAACLMMSNLAAELKQHAVTLYEVGKIPHESLDDFLVAAAEVERLPPHEAELLEYFDHAIALRDAARFLRSHPAAAVGGVQRPLDIVRTESLLSLEPQKRRRVLEASYALLVSMAPMVSPAEHVFVRTPLRPAPPASRTSAPPRRRSSRRGSRSSFTRSSAPARRRSSSAAAAASARCRRTSHRTRRCASSLGRASPRSSAAAPPSPPPMRCSSTLRCCCSRTRRDRAHRPRRPCRRRIGGGAGRGGGGGVGEAGV